MLILYIIYKSLQVEKRCVSFVAVVKLALYAKFLKHEHTADTEEIFLLDTVFPITAIKLVGNDTVKFAVHIEIGIKQI